MRRQGSGAKPGDFITAEGEVIGRHRGITHYTVGQRKGLGLSMGRPVFVTEIRPETNEVVIGGSDEVFPEDAARQPAEFHGGGGAEDRGREGIPREDPV